MDQDELTELLMGLSKVRGKDDVLALVEDETLIQQTPHQTPQLTGWNSSSVYPSGSRM